MKTTPVEFVLLGIALAAPLNIAAQEQSLPDAALLEFLAEWDEADPDWLDAELNAQLNAEASAGLIDDVTDGTAQSARTEKGHE